MNKQEMEQFVAQQTGLELERAAKILKLGEPWPFVKAFGQFVIRSSNDARESDVPLGAVLKANASLVKMGVDSLDADAIHRHLARTADLSGEKEQTVRGVQSALHEYFMLQIRNIERVLRRDIASQRKKQDDS
jgi:hypothetical protein